jgi:hypothetical protein
MTRTTIEREYNYYLGVRAAARRHGLMPVASIALAAALSVATSPASAQFVCTTTSTDSTCTNSGAATGNTNSANGPNQNATTTNSGTVNGSIVVVTNAGGNATGTNTGTNSGDLFVVAGSGGNATATNTGTNGFGVTAVASGLGTATVINSGTNSNGGLLAENTGSGNAYVTNSGFNAGGIAAQVFGITGDAIAVNSGTNLGSVSVEARGNATFINSGTSTGTNGIFTFGTGNALTVNYGTISGSVSTETLGTGNASVFNSGTINGLVYTQAAAGSRGLVVNSGAISNFGGTAIQFGGGPDTLQLLPGSFIIGGISLVGTNDTVDVRAGNLNLTFNTLAGATVTGTVPFAVSGNRIASIDPTPFALADKNLMDFTRAVSSILGSLGDSTTVSSGPAATAFAPETGSNRIGDAFASIPALAYAGNDNIAFKNPTMVYGDGRSVWARSFAGERFQQADGADARAHNLFEGGAIGADLLVRPDLRFGIFAGGGHSQLSLDRNLGNTTTDTVFGGVYGRYIFSSFGAPSFLDFALHGGGSSNGSSRTINNNLLANGLETATASYGSSYISPEMTYGVKLPLWAEYTLTPSLRLRYVAGRFDGYTETGSTADLTVASRTIQDFEQRGELKLTHTTAFTPKDALLTSVNVGVLGVERVGDTTVNTILLGQNLPFITPGRNAVAGVFGGLGMEWRTRSGVSLFGAAEYTAMSDQANTIVGRGGIKVAF